MIKTIKKFSTVERKNAGGGVMMTDFVMAEYGCRFLGITYSFQFFFSCE